MRTDYYNDPNAPAPNSVVPSASAIVTDEHGRILLIKRRDNTLWALPGGGHDIGETIADTAVREVKEETGLDVKVTGLVGVYTNPATWSRSPMAKSASNSRSCSPPRCSAAPLPSTTKARTSPGLHPTRSLTWICIRR